MDPIAFESLPLTASVRPALSRIDYAADDPVSLRDRLLERLPASLPGWNATLAFEGSDHARLLAELFAQLGAILCAYADQRANESYLRTAQLPRSLIDLCELIDVRLGAGASATALQAFFAKPGTTGTLPRAFRLQAPPPPGTVPASDLLFETLAAWTCTRRVTRCGWSATTVRAASCACATCPRRTRTWAPRWTRHMRA
jgi:hypothetical protein